MNGIIATWRDALHQVLDIYERKRGAIQVFFPLLFLFFILLNVACYWWAIYTAFPHYMLTHEASHYLKLQIPVGIFGALFDSLSFFVTIWIIRRALASTKTSEYVFSSLPGPCHRHSGHPLGPLRVYLRRVDHKPLGKRARGTRPKRNQVHQPRGSGSAGSDWTGKCQKHLLRTDHGRVRRPAHLPAPGLVFAFRLPKVQKRLVPPERSSSHFTRSRRTQLISCQTLVCGGIRLDYESTIFHLPGKRNHALPSRFRAQAGPSPSGPDRTAALHPSQSDQGRSEQNHPGSGQNRIQTGRAILGFPLPKRST